MRHSILVAVEGSKAAPKGLEGVVATTTAICSVSDNFLQYRGYRIEELVGKAEYEEVAYLLLNGELPNKEELRDFKAELTKHRTLSPFLRGLLQEMSETGTGMDVHRARRRGHQRGHACGGDRCLRRPQGSTARRGNRRDDEDARRDRLTRPRRLVRRQGDRAEVQVLRVRASRVPHRGSPREVPPSLRDRAVEGVEGQAVFRDPGAPREGDRRAPRQDVARRGCEGERRERRLLRGHHVHVPRHPGGPRYVDLRRRADGWLVRARDGAARRQPPDPARVRVHRAEWKALGPARREITDH